MALRVGIDMDGTIADLSSAYRDVERRLFGDRPSTPSPASVDDVLQDTMEAESEEREEGDRARALGGKAAVKAARRESRERDLIWQAIRQTEDFWLGLRPLEPGVVGRLNEASMAFGWEVFFITQRPGTAGQTVQRQTQQWLVREGFDMPSVLTLRGGRGRAAASLELDVLLDDHPKNCVDVVSESRCRPILIVRAPSATAEGAARQLRIAVARSVTEALALIEAPRAEPRPGFVRRMFRGATRESRARQ